MSKLYTDYINKIALTVPDQFIDVKTGESYMVSSKVHEQIEYHAENQTLIHLVLSALNSYLHPKRVNGSSNEILNELSEIKEMLRNGYSATNFVKSSVTMQPPLNELNLDMRDIEDILEEFGG